MVSSYIGICLACCSRKSFRSLSPPPSRNSIPPTNTSIKNNTFNDHPFQISKNKSPYKSQNQFSPKQNQNAATKGAIYIHGSTSRPSGSTRSSHHYLEGPIGILKKRMLSAPTLSTRKPYQTPRTREERREKENDRSEQDEEWYMVKKITPGERNRIPDDADEPIFYDRNGNRVHNYRRRTPRSLPVSRTGSAEEDDFKIE